MNSILITGLKGGIGRTTVAEALRYVCEQENIEAEILDGHARLNCDLRQKVKTADYALIVVEDGVFGQLDIAFMAKELLKDQTRCGVVINKARDMEDVGLQELLLELNIPLLGSIAFNPYYAYVLSEEKNLAQEDKTVYDCLKNALAVMLSIEPEQ